MMHVLQPGGTIVVEDLECPREADGPPVDHPAYSRFLELFNALVRRGSRHAAGPASPRTPRAHGSRGGELQSVPRRSGTGERFATQRPWSWIPSGTPSSPAASQPGRRWTDWHPNSTASGPPPRACSGCRGSSRSGAASRRWGAVSDPSGCRRRGRVEAPPTASRLHPASIPPLRVTFRGDHRGIHWPEGSPRLDPPTLSEDGQQAQRSPGRSSPHAGSGSTT